MREPDAPRVASGSGARRATAGRAYQAARQFSSLVVPTLRSQA